MGYEIERKFLVGGDFKSHAHFHYVMKQGYLSLSGTSVVRVRIKGEKGYITVSSIEGENGITRREWEYEIPPGHAHEKLHLCREGVDELTHFRVQIRRHTIGVQ